MRKLLFILFLLASVVSYGTTRYVATAANGGSNSNAGTIGSPWLTVAYACSQVSTAGDVIQIGAGTFTETTQMSLAVGVSMVGAGVTTIIIPTYEVTDGYDGCILLDSYGSAANGNQSISYLKIDGDYGNASRAICVIDRNNVEIHHLTIINCDHGGVRFRGISTNRTGNSVHDCTINDCGDYTIDYACNVSLDLQATILIYNNSFSNTGRSEGHNGNIIAGLMGVKGLKIYNNIFNKPDHDGDAWNFNIELWRLSDECEMYGNTFNGAASNDFADIRKGSGSYGLKIYENDFIVPSNTDWNVHMNVPITVEDHGAIQYLYVYDNYFKNTANGVEVTAWVDETDTQVNVDHVYIYSNLFENIGQTSHYWGFPIDIQATDNPGYEYNGNIIWDEIQVFNNTMTALQSPQAYQGIRWGAGGTATNIKIRNNIIQGFSNYPIAFLVTIAGATIDVLSVENNLYYLNSTNAANYGSVTITNKTEQNNLVGDPDFVSSSDFHLQSSSPAIDAGIDFGLAYSGAAPDIGVYEYDNGYTPPAGGAGQTVTYYGKIVKYLGQVVKY